MFYTRAVKTSYSFPFFSLTFRKCEKIDIAQAFECHLNKNMKFLWVGGV
jgi:hypothetical protein